MTAEDLHRFYQILGLPDGASRTEVHAAYRQLAKTWHPDCYAHAPKLQAQATVIMAEINVAHRMLMAPDICGDALTDEHAVPPIPHTQQHQMHRRASRPAPAQQAAWTVRPSHAWSSAPRSAPIQHIQPRHVLVFVVLVIVILIFVVPDSLDVLIAIVDYVGTDGGLTY